MRFKFLVIALAVILPGFAGAQTVDFATSVNNTLSQNPQRDASLARIDQASAAVKQATYSRLPQLNLSLTASRSNNPLNVFGMKLQQQQATFRDFGFASFDFTNPDMDVKPSDLNKPDAQTDYNTRLELLLPVWNGGKISSAKNQSKAMLEAAQSGDVAVQQMLTYYVYEAYEGVHAARSFIQVSEQALKASRAVVATTENLVNQGVVVRSELLSAKAHLADVNSMYEQAKNHEQLALDGLRSLMGMEFNAPLDVAGREEISLPSNDLDELTRRAVNNNPQLLALRGQSKAASAKARGAKADLYPSLNLMARNDWNDDRLGFSSSAYTVAAVASWKITDFGVTSRGIDQANAAANEQKAKVRSMEQEVKLDILKAWRSYQNELKKLESHQAAVDYATEAQSLITRRYETGVATITEVLAGQAQLDKARADLVNSQYQVNMQKAGLRLATGSMSLKEL